jgi:transcriptional regulator with XRE-family HTH domain
VCLNKVIQDSIAKNRKVKRSPRSLAELSEMLDRDKINVFRWRRGLSEPSITDMSSLAELLNVPIAVLFPQKLEFLADTVNILCKGKLRQNDILAFTEYLLLCDQLTSDINLYTNYIEILNYTDSNALYTRAISTGAEPAGRTGVERQSITRSIQKVVDRLEPILQSAVAQAL